MSKKNESDIRLEFLHVEGEVTHSSVFIQVDGLNILFDMGLFQSNTHSVEQIYKINHREIPIPYSELDYLILSHLHSDHVCGCGVLGKKDNGFKGSIICTEITQSIMEINLKDCAFLQQKECEFANRHRAKNPLSPMYDTEDVEHLMGFVRGYRFDEEIKLSDKVSIRLLSNGHIAGSSAIYLTYKKDEYTTKTVLYTGDHSFGKDKPFSMAWKYKDLKADIIITESTYSGINTRKSNPIDELEQYIMEECVQKGNVLFLPVFSIGRSTELIYMLSEIYKRNPRVQEIPITFASPMLVKSHRIIGKPSSFCFYDDKWSKFKDIFEWDKVNFIEKFKDVESKLYNSRSRIVGASSGMITGGYSKALLHSYLPNKKVSFLFTGYAGMGTNARKILDGEQKQLSVDNKPLKINANILGLINGMSSHADDSGLKGLIATCDTKKIKKICIIHGEIKRQQGFKEDLEKIYPNVDVIIPKTNEIIKI